MTIAMVNYVIYVFFPIPIPLEETFPWPRWVSILIAILISIPSGYLWFRGMKDAGEETMFVKQEHTLYGGIYEKIRHPQAVGELPFWFVIAFLFHSPFLVLYSFIWVPIFWIMCMAEEKDLVIRYGKAYEEYQKRVGAFFPKRS
jgi:protein-S-isoprenylcysteine O-methyltransferase Ste14